MKKALACKSCGGKVKMKSGGKVKVVNTLLKSGGKKKNYKNAGTTDTEPEKSTSSATPPLKPMSRAEFKDAKKAKKQQRKLRRIEEKKNAMDIITPIGAGLSLVKQVIDMTTPNKKRGGSVHKMPNGKMMKGKTHKKK